MTFSSQIGDVPLVALPLFHIGGLAGPPWFVYQGLKTVLLRSLDPKRFLELLGEEKVSGFGSVPALLDFLKLVPDFEKYDWGSVQVILVYAAPVPVTTQVAAVGQGRLLANHEFRDALDNMSSGIGVESIVEKVKQNKLEIAFKGSGFVLTAGYLSWALRGVSLMASAMAMPTNSACARVSVP